MDYGAESKSTMPKIPKGLKKGGWEGAAYIYPNGDIFSIEDFSKVIGIYDIWYYSGNIPEINAPKNTWIYDDEAESWDWDKILDKAKNQVNKEYKKLEAEEKKNCGCGQDPCITYGAETFEATTGYGYDDPPERMTDEEAWLEMYDNYLEAITPLHMETGQDGDSPMTLEEFKKDWIKSREEDYQMQVKYDEMVRHQPQETTEEYIKRIEEEGRAKEEKEVKQLMKQKGISYEEALQMVMDNAMEDYTHRHPYDAESFEAPKTMTKSQAKKKFIALAQPYWIKKLTSLKEGFIQQKKDDEKENGESEYFQQYDYDIEDTNTYLTIAKSPSKIINIIGCDDGDTVVREMIPDGFYYLINYPREDYDTWETTMTYFEGPKTIKKQLKALLPIIEGKPKATKKTTTRKSKAKVKTGRKAPTISATRRKIGTRMRGNDGKMWEVKKSGKSQRWMAGAEENLHSETDAYSFAYSQGHNDGHKDTGYKPQLTRTSDEKYFRKILNQRAESYGAEGISKKYGLSWIDTEETDETWDDEMEVIEKHLSSQGYKKCGSGQFFSNRTYAYVLYRFRYYLRELPDKIKGYKGVVEDREYLNYMSDGQFVFSPWENKAKNKVALVWQFQDTHGFLVSEPYYKYFSLTTPPSWYDTKFELHIGEDYRYDSCPICDYKNPMNSLSDARKLAAHIYSHGPLMSASPFEDFSIEVPQPSWSDEESLEVSWGNPMAPGIEILESRLPYLYGLEFAEEWSPTKAQDSRYKKKSKQIKDGLRAAGFKPKR